MLIQTLIAATLMQAAAGCPNDGLAGVTALGTHVREQATPEGGSVRLYRLSNVTHLGQTVPYAWVVSSFNGNPSYVYYRLGSEFSDVAPPPVATAAFQRAYPTAEECAESCQHLPGNPEAIGILRLAKLRVSDVVLAAEGLDFIENDRPGSSAARGHRRVFLECWYQDREYAEDEFDDGW